MLQRFLIVAAAVLALTSCGRAGDGKSAGDTTAGDTTPAVQFRNDANLVPLPLPPILESATGIGVQYIERISPGGSGLISQESPIGTVQAIIAPAATDLTVEIPSGSRELIVAFGMLPPSYTNTGTTKGVCFIVELDGAAPAERELWQRCLRPIEEEGDRGMQEASVTLPDGTGRVVLRTLSAAASGELSWGWSYWANPRTGPGS
jgi:hypothetical protein